MRKNNYSRKITGAELLVLLQDGQRTTISIKELSDILTSKYESEGQLCSIKRDLENLNAKIKEINCNSNYAVQASEKALNTVKTQDDLLKEALRSAKQAEYDILKLEGAVERYNRKLNDLVVTIETDTTSVEIYNFKIYEGEELIRDYIPYRYRGYACLKNKINGNISFMNSLGNFYVGADVTEE